MYKEEKEHRTEVGQGRYLYHGVKGGAAGLLRLHACPLDRATENGGMGPETDGEKGIKSCEEIPYIYRGVLCVLVYNTIELASKS